MMLLCFFRVSLAADCAKKVAGIVVVRLFSDRLLATPSLRFHTPLIEPGGPY
jgi:hypothetical protein